MDYTRVLPDEILASILQMAGPTVSDLCRLRRISIRFQVTIRNCAKFDDVRIYTDRCFNHIRALRSLTKNIHTLSICDFGQVCECLNGNEEKVARELLQLISSSNVRNMTIDLCGKKNRITDYMVYDGTQFPITKLEFVTVRTQYQEITETAPIYVNLSWIPIRLKHLTLERFQPRSHTPIKADCLSLYTVTLNKQLSEMVDLTSVDSLNLDCISVLGHSIVEFTKFESACSFKVANLFPNLREFNLATHGHNFCLGGIQSIITLCKKIKHINVSDSYLVLDREYSCKSPLHDTIRPISVSASNSRGCQWILRYGECEIKLSGKFGFKYNCWKYPREKFGTFHVDFERTKYASLLSLISDCIYPERISDNCKITLAQASKLISFS